MNIITTNCGYSIRSSVPHIVLDITVRTVEGGKRFEYSLCDYDKCRTYKAVWDDTLDEFGIPSSTCDIPNEYRLVADAMEKAMSRKGIAIKVPTGDYFNEWRNEYDDYTRAVEFDHTKFGILRRIHERHGKTLWVFHKCRDYQSYTDDEWLARCPAF